MQKDNKKDYLIESFLDSLYIEKGLSKNTVQSYKNDITSLMEWSVNSLSISLKNFGENNNDIYANLQHNTGSINNRNR